MKERFDGEDGRRLLKQSILDQQCVAHHEAVANAILDRHELLEFKPGEVLIEQGGSDTHIFLILIGSVAIKVNGREMAVRQSRQHVGEMATIDHTARRSATVVALEETVALKVDEPVWAAIANDHPDLWRRLAMELADRLRQRSKYVREPNPRPMLFIGSSVEGLTVANQIQLGLSHDYVVPQVWTNNVFTAGHGTMEDLEERITRADFGVLVCTADDRVINEQRGVDEIAPRDNVILELGMCLGALGRYRTFLVRPRTRDLKIPTDLLGITPVDYVADDMENIGAHIGPVCTQIRTVVQKLGVR